MTQLDLAGKVDVTPEHIGRLAPGKNTPGFQTLELLAETLDVPVKSLFDCEAVEKN